MPAGHPEGYIEAFAQLYVDAALQIAAVNAGQPIPESARWLTNVDDGVAGMAFIDAVLRSHQNDAQWTDIAD